MLGLTICALDYELKNNSCVELFMTYPAPGLLRREVGLVDGLREVLYTGLQDNVTAILNEGAARGLVSDSTVPSLLWVSPGQKRILRDSRDGANWGCVAI